MSLGDHAIDPSFTVAGHPKGGGYTGEGLAVVARRKASVLRKVALILADRSAPDP